MKYIIICLIAYITLACSPKRDPAEQRMKRHFIAEQLKENQLLSSYIIEEASHSMRPSVLAALQRSKIVSTLRDEYLAHQNIDGLLKYSDAMLIGYDTLSVNDPNISEAIRNYRKDVLDAGDSSSIENLVLHTLYAESTLLEHYSQEAS